MVNILFLITGLHVGGAEMQVYQMIKGLKHMNYRPIVVSLLPVGPIGEKLEEEGITVYSLDMERGKASISAVVQLNKILRKEKITIIHSHLFHANILARLMKLFHPTVKVVNTIHNINIGGRKRERLLQYTNSLSDGITIISQAAKEHFIKVGAVSEERLRFLPNGVDTDIYQEKMSSKATVRRNLKLGDDFIWLAVGRFDKQKNYPNLLKSFRYVLNEKKQSYLLIVGIGTLLEEMKSLAADLNIADRVRFLGYRQDIPDLMSAADGFVMSSDWEGMPLVLLEASCVGLPIVCTDVGGNKEVVIHKQTGLLVKPKCSLSLSENMLQLMEMSEEERKEMGECGKNYIRDVYDLEQVIDQWDQLYQQVLSKSS
ncbi:glycosyltransferase [Bacillus sp. FJAT-52991]|uniref:Glycosyltransferase n=1 Tax=Bacillus kandeliae TaxID=3129297 RepID=A0ABZ2N7D1_9BACI